MNATQAGNRPLPIAKATARVSRRSCTSRKVTTEVLLGLETEIALRVFETLDTPRSLACYLMVKNHEYNQYLDLKRPDSSAETFADDYLCTELLAKSPNLPSSTLNHRVTKATERFLEAESLCKDTNDRFRSYFAAPERYHKELHTILAVQRILCNALGPLTPAKLESIKSSCRFGPGASSCVSGRDVLLSKKYAHPKPGCTPTLAPFVRSLYGVDEVKLVDSSSVRFVPKNAKTERTIAIEPHLNGFVQLGIASLLRSTMRRVGLHPNDSGFNRKAAQHALKYGYATIDLSMASDTISYEVVKALLPVDWFWLLGLARTGKSTMPDGSVIHLEKFSAMGNGYTWELESLIFWAACSYVCGDSVVLVFGDDIVVEERYVESLRDILTLFGFRMNVEKSFWQGPFRESCGADFCNGRNVRPFYLRATAEKAVSLERQAVIYANLLFKYAVGDGDFPDTRLKSVWRWLAKQAGPYRNYHIPWEGPIDGGLIVASDLATATWRYDRNLFTWSYSFLRHDPVVARNTSSDGALMAYLHLSPRFKEAGETVFSEEFLRGSISRCFKVNRTPISKTKWVGAWL